MFDKLPGSVQYVMIKDEEFTKVVLNFKEAFDWLRYPGFSYELCFGSSN